MDVNNSKIGSNYCANAVIYLDFKCLKIQIKSVLNLSLFECFYRMREIGVDTQFTRNRQ
jgi:hypothetical protein